MVFSLAAFLQICYTCQRTQGDQPGTGCGKYSELKNQALQYLTQMVFS